MSEFFFSVPGALVCAGIGALCLIRRQSRPQASRDTSSVRLKMQIGVSIVILGAGLWVILSGHYNADAERWAAGALGTVVGYWLKP